MLTDAQKAMVESMKHTYPESDEASMTANELMTALGMTRTQVRGRVEKKLASGEWVESWKKDTRGVLVKSYKPAI